MPLMAPGTSWRDVGALARAGALGGDAFVGFYVSASSRLCPLPATWWLLPAVIGHGIKARGLLPGDRHRPAAGHRHVALPRPRRANGASRLTS